MKIYLKLQEKPKTIKDLLLSLFSYGTSYRRTNVETYYDKECFLVQCNINKYRSFDEVYYIILTYFPETTLEQAIHELITLDFGLEEPLYIKMTNCSTINRIVLYYTSEYFTNSIFGINKYNSLHSWDSLLSKLNIINRDELKDYIKKFIKIKDNIIDKIKTWEDVLKYSNTKEEDILPWKNPINKKQISQNALAKIQLITEVLNEGTILDFNNENIVKYIPYFKKDALLGWVYDSCRFCYFVSHDGFGCYFKSSSLAIYAGNQFLDIYKDYLP